MNSRDFFAELSDAKRMGHSVGIVSICSAHELVLRASMEIAQEYDMPVLIETTANQVNQFGGYTGMYPSDFIDFARNIASGCGFPQDKILFGGDHLGPLVWRDRPENEAMKLAEELVSAYVKAGFTKIHIDTSMRLGTDDPRLPLPDEICAVRGAQLCLAAEAAWHGRLKDVPNASAPVYVIGSEVPTPGGHQHHEGNIQITSPHAFRDSLNAFSKAFCSQGLHSALERVIAFVVQPGVEFSNSEIYSYDRKAAALLCASLCDYPDLVFEGHSTDYQTPTALREMVEDGIAILKVGPALSFACREALFSLEYIEQELLSGLPKPLSDFRRTLDTAMCADDSHWRAHYIGNEIQNRFDRAYSFYDRARYYLGCEPVAGAINTLFTNLEERNIPLSLISQFMPLCYSRIGEGKLEPSPVNLVLDHIKYYLERYYFATKPGYM